MATKKLQILDSLNKNAVLYTPQELTEEERAQVRENLAIPSLDENGKIPASQLPDDIGSGGGLTEVSWEDVKNKPFYDTRKMSYYSQAENPNPPQIDNAMMNMSCYKVSDLVPTRTEIFNSTKLIVNGTEYMLAESGIQLETDDFIYVYETKMMFGFIFVNKSGTLNFTASGYSMSIEVPEGGEGIYYQRLLNAGVPEGRTIEFIIGGELKTIDPKYIADMYYDTRKIYHFDSSKTPNPPSFSVAAFGVNGYKAFDLTPTLEEFFNYKINMNRSGSVTECTFINKQIQLSWDNFWLIQSDDTYNAFGLCRSAGTFEADYQGISIICEVPEPGIYLIWSQPPSNMTLEINLGGELKQIDPKFIPADLDFNLDDYYTKSETYSQSEISNLVNNNLARYYTKSEVDNAINNVSLALNGYYTKDETYSKSEVDDALNNIDLSNYYTKTESDNMYYTKSEVNSAINKIDLSKYYTKTESDNRYYTKSEVNSAITSNNLSYYTKTEIDEITGDISTILDEINALIGE